MDKAVFPAEMTALKQWICWRLEPDPNGGKDKKVPISPKTGKKALVNNPSTWSTFEEAVQAKEKYGYNGIGFVFTTDSGIVAIDIDDCFINGVINEVGKAILAKAPKTYVEKSPSGKGLHMLVRGKLPGGGKRSQELHQQWAPHGEVVLGFMGRLAAEKMVSDLTVVSQLPGPDMDCAMPSLNHVGKSPLSLPMASNSNDLINCYHPKDEEGFSDLFKYKYSINYASLEPFEKIVLFDITFTAISLKHSKNTFGYLIEYEDKTIAYLTDCNEIPKESLDFLKSKTIDFAFIDACYDERRTTGNHLNYLQASEILDLLNVKNGFLIHISHITQEYIMKNSIKLKYPYIDSKFTLDFI